MGEAWPFGVRRSLARRAQRKESVSLYLLIGGVNRDGSPTFCEQKGQFGLLRFCFGPVVSSVSLYPLNEE